MSEYSQQTFQALITNLDYQQLNDLLTYKLITCLPKERMCNHRLGMRNKKAASNLEFDDTKRKQKLLFLIFRSDLHLLSKEFKTREHHAIARGNQHWTVRHWKKNLPTVLDGNSFQSNSLSTLVLFLEIETLLLINKPKHLFVITWISNQIIYSNTLKLCCMP